MYAKRMKTSCDIDDAKYKIRSRSRSGSLQVSSWKPMVRQFAVVVHSFVLFNAEEMGPQLRIFRVTVDWLV